MATKKQRDAERRKVGRLISKLIRQSTTPAERTASARNAARARWAQWRAAHKVPPIVESDTDTIT